MPTAYFNYPTIRVHRAEPRDYSTEAFPTREDSNHFPRPTVTDVGSTKANNSTMTPESLGQVLAEFLDGAQAAVVIEDGSIAFNLSESMYSISGEYNKCLLHLWSHERNVVRRVLDAEVKSTTLRLQVQRMGQNRPTRLDFCRDRDQRSPAARRAARTAYEPSLRRALERNFPEWTIVRLTTTASISNALLVRPICAAGFVVGSGAWRSLE